MKIELVRLADFEVGDLNEFLNGEFERGIK